MMTARMSAGSSKANRTMESDLEFYAALGFVLFWLVIGYLAYFGIIPVGS